jgi:hypothetical protein
VNARSRTVTDEIVKEQAELLGQQMSVTDFVNKNYYVFCSKNEIVLKMNTIAII